MPYEEFLCPSSSHCSGICWYLLIKTCLYLSCLALQGVMVDPVIAGDGHTYERVAIAAWLERQHTSPVTQAPLPHPRLVPNLLIKGAIASQRLQLSQQAAA